MSPLFASCSLGAPEGIINRALRSNNKSSSSNNNNNNICIMSARTIRTVTTPVYTCLHAWLIPRKAEYENNKSTERHDNTKQQTTTAIYTFLSCPRVCCKEAARMVLLMYVWWCTTETLRE